MRPETFGVLDPEINQTDETHIAFIGRLACQPSYTAAGRRDVYRLSPATENVQRALPKFRVSPNYFLVSPNNAAAPSQLHQLRPNFPHKFVGVHSSVRISGSAVAAA